MSDKDELFKSAGETVGYLRLYAQQQVDFYKLELAEKSSILLSSMVTTLVQILVGFTLVGFLSLAAAFYIKEITGSFITAFLLVAAFYFLLMIILYIFRYRLITNPVLSMILRKIYSKQEP